MAPWGTSWGTLHPQNEPSLTDLATRQLFNRPRFPRLRHTLEAAASRAVRRRSTRYGQQGGTGTAFQATALEGECFKFFTTGYTSTATNRARARRRRPLPKAGERAPRQAWQRGLPQGRGSTAATAPDCGQEARADALGRYPKSRDSPPAGPGDAPRALPPRTARATQGAPPCNVPRVPGDAQRGSA